MYNDENRTIISAESKDLFNMTKPNLMKRPLSPCIVAMLLLVA
ncbi:unnamed protein product, partial [marine sediment metagenome]